MIFSLYKVCHEIVIASFIFSLKNSWHGPGVLWLSSWFGLMVRGCGESTSCMAGGGLEFRHKGSETRVL